MAMNGEPRGLFGRNRKKPEPEPNELLGSVATGRYGGDVPEHHAPVVDEEVTGEGWFGVGTVIGAPEGGPVIDGATDDSSTPMRFEDLEDRDPFGLDEPTSLGDMLNGVAATDEHQWWIPPTPNTAASAVSPVAMPGVPIIPIAPPAPTTPTNWFDAPTPPPPPAPAWDTTVTWIPPPPPPPRPEDHVEARAFDVSGTDVSHGDLPSIDSLSIDIPLEGDTFPVDSATAETADAPSSEIVGILPQAAGPDSPWPTIEIGIGFTELADHDYEMTPLNLEVATTEEPPVTMTPTAAPTPAFAGPAWSAPFATDSAQHDGWLPGDPVAEDFDTRLDRGVHLASNIDQLKNLATRAFNQVGHGADLRVFAAKGRTPLATFVESNRDGVAMCSAANGQDCPAVRTGESQLFENSDFLDACPMLLDRTEPCSAVCIAVVNDESTIVLHAVSPATAPASERTVFWLDTTIRRVNSRLGELQAEAPEPEHLPEAHAWNA
jgi:hypothetical protein